MTSESNWQTVTKFVLFTLEFFSWHVWVMEDESYFRDYTKTPWTSLSKPTTNEFKFQMFKIIILEFFAKNHSNFTLIRNYFRSTGSSCFLFISWDMETTLVNGVILIKICKNDIEFCTWLPKLAKFFIILNSSKAKHSKTIKISRI